MITPMLEKALLNGWATFQTVNHAFSSFGAIPVPKNCTCIITHVKWFPFNDVYPGFSGFPARWREMFAYNEYQLKIDGKLSKNYLQFRNEFKWRWFPDSDTISGSINNLDDLIDPEFMKKFFLFESGLPIITDVFFPCNEYIKLSITRNAYIHKFATVYGPLQPQAHEQAPPNGLEGVNLLLRNQMNSNANAQFLYPGTIELDGNDIPGQNRKLESYTQDIDKNESILSDIIPGTLQEHFPYHTLPLVELGIVTITNTQFDKIKTQ